MSILLPVTIENITTRKDSTLKVVLGTQEVNPEQAGKLFELLNKYAVTYISGKDISKEQIQAVDEVDIDLGGKSQSERIRNTLFVLFNQDAEGFSTFDNYYQSKTEKYLEHLKSKIKN